MKNDDAYDIKVKTWTGSIKSLTMTPTGNIQPDITTLSNLSCVSQEDKNLFSDAIKYEKDLNKKNQ